MAINKVDISLYIPENIRVTEAYFCGQFLLLWQRLRLILLHLGYGYGNRCNATFIFGFRGVQNSSLMPTALCILWVQYVL